MASRRTRIKGIANIPQRRKTINAPLNSDEQVKPAPEVEKIEDAELNLTFQHADQEEDGQQDNSKESVEEHKEPSTNNIDVSPTNEIEKNEKNEETLTTGIEENLLTCEVKDVNDTKSSEEVSDKGPKPIIPIRRKFIKPVVSINAIIRKQKDTEDSKQSTQKPPRNNKIVILDEIITHPNQDQPIVIESFKKKDCGAEEPYSKSPDEDSTKIAVIPVERDAKKVILNNPPAINSDNEYPIPPPSPSKVNRTRIKAVPRLSQRNTSFSASESEDESRRNYRHRNDSVCSTASGFQDSNSITECPSPQKPKEFNSVIQRKCRRTEQSRKLAEARRDFYIKFGNKKPDRQKLTMIDLIFYNPTTNLMSHETKSKKDDAGTDNVVNSEELRNEEKVDDPDKSGSDEENEIPAPQIKIGPQGEIVVDEQSLVIESKAVKKSREELEKSKVVNGDFDTGYGVYKRAKRSKDWSKHETLKFYKALNTIGTDFTLMCELFPRRSRRELKMKFKKEERINKALIDRAIMQPCGFDFNDFKHEVEMEEKELLELEKQKEREQQLKKEEKKRKASLALKNGNPTKVAKVEEKPKEKKKKPLDIMNVLDDNSDADESEMESVFGEEDVEEDDAQSSLLQTIQKPTRSGRVPKLLNRYKPVEPKPAQAEPGSLIVVAGTGSNGEPVYRVCMVTAEQNRQQIGEDMDSLSKALECKQNNYIKSLFTLSSTTIPTQDQNEVVEENNVTIPADEYNVTIPAEEYSVVIDENITIPVEGDTCVINDKGDIKE